MKVLSPQHIMFDIDGTLIHSCEFDGICYDEAVKEITGLDLHPDRSYYQHVSDEGILRQHFFELGEENTQQKITEIKNCFIQKIDCYLAKQPAVEIPGAKDLITHLQSIPNISLSFATGGWAQSARLKLASAGFNISGIPLASSDDHYKRTEIMLTAKRLAHISDQQKITYIGDGSWDAKATQSLKWNFILLGSATQHVQKLDDLSNIKAFKNFLYQEEGSHETSS